MKKVKIAFIGLMLLGFTAGVYAQDKAATDKKTKPAKSAKTTSTKKTDATTKTDKTATPAKDSKGTSTGGQHLKKDGTPDKRYKENKAVKSTKATTDKK